VTGPFFSQLHDLFGKIYKEVYKSIDHFAEEIRSAGAFVPASYTRFSMLSQIEDETSIPDDGDMVAELLADSDKMVKILKYVFDIATELGEEGLADFVAQRMDAHRKHSWMLRATISQ
jgi:starvation-inducible DNA-binding protein